MKLKRLIALSLALLTFYLGSVACAATVRWVAVVTSRSSVYASPDYSSKKLGTLNKNQSLAIIESKDGWSKVELNGNVGFMPSGYLKRTTKSMYVCKPYMTIFASNNASSKKLDVCYYGEKVNLEATSGNWARVTCGKVTGFCDYSYLTSTNPNNMDKTVYTQSDNIKVYYGPDTSTGAICTVKSGMKLVLTAIYKDSWCRVKNGSAVGFIQKKYLDTSLPKKAEESLDVTVYTQKDNLKVYESARTSAKVIATVNANMKLVCTQIIDNKWCRVKNGSAVGYIQKSYLDTKKADHLNTMTKTVYTQKDDIKIYADASTSSSVLMTVDRNQKLTCKAVLDDTWCRVQSGSKYGYIHKSYVGTSKVNAYSTETPAVGKSKAADWWTSGIASKFARGETAIVTDVATGISWRVYRGGGTNHADVQPFTAEDTAAMKKACGSDYGTWRRRAIWVTVDGQKYAASMNCMPHGDGSIRNNNFDGHYCIHFTNSRTHGTNSVCSLHQAAIRKALAAG